VAFTGASAGALAVGSLAVGASVPWLCGVLAVAAVVAFRLTKKGDRSS
jgi:hypothetical protein